MVDKREHFFNIHSVCRCHFGLSKSFHSFLSFDFHKKEEEKYYVIMPMRQMRKTKVQKG